MALVPGLCDVRVHFDFALAQLRDDDHGKLDRVARCLRADRSLHVTIEGNADERGTSEYNMALGEQRARAIERYLSLHGVSTERLRTVSYGEERPLCTEQTEACFQQNRRAHVSPTDKR